VGDVGAWSPNGDEGGPAGHGGVAIEVIDDGRGIAPEVRDRIFEAFFTTKPPGEGTGLGLSISAGIIQAHHGRIDVEAMPGRGTRFTVLLPRPAPDPQEGRGGTPDVAEVRPQEPTRGFL
jgi:two-component system NtrC family sensor kinase